MKVLVLLASALLLGASPAEARRLEIASVEASSTFPDEGRIRYDAGQLVDGKVSTAWVEGEDGSGLGSWLELDLGGERTVHKVKVWPGFWYSREFWHRTNRPRELEIRWSDGTSDRFEIPDAMEPFEAVLATPRRTRSARLIVRNVYAGNTWLDTAISEIQLFDAEAGDAAVPRAFAASSQLPNDADGIYDPKNVGDALVDSMWCEGSEEGDGTGEWIEVRFPGLERVSSLHLVNGIGTGLPYWMKGNRATRAQLRFSDDTTVDVDLRNTMLPQDVTFPPRLTSSVRVTFTGIVRGKEYNQLCISEARFE